VLIVARKSTSHGGFTTLMLSCIMKS
jgi:hypothetical protein